MNDPSFGKLRTASVRLICIAAYHNTATGERYRRADVLEVTAERAVFLLADAPGSFRYDDVRALPDVDAAGTAEVEVAAVTPEFVGGNVVAFDAVPLAGKILPARKRTR